MILKKTLTLGTVQCHHSSPIHCFTTDGSL